jgi:hypothetical protein
MKNYSQTFRIKGKKGNAVIEGLTILVVLAIFAIAGLYAYSTFDELNTDIQDNPDMDNQSKDMSGSLFSVFPGWIDNAFLFIFVLLVIFVIVSVFMIDTHPIFFAISIILLIAVFVAAIFIGNAYYDIATDATISSYANDMPYMAWVMNHIAEMIIAVGFITGLALFVKVKML